MKFITFKLLEGKNFLSFGNTTNVVELRPGVNAIIGTNCDKEDSKNGAGKSSITELLYYALFGTTLREISKDFIQNSQTKKRCDVKLEFDITSNNVVDSYIIHRKLNPTQCKLIKNGEDITRSTLAKTNALIKELIHTPATVFQNSVIMSANNAQPFMALPKTDKRKFVESVLGLEIFTQMVLRARDDYSITKRDYELNYAKLEQLRTELVFNETQLSNYEELKTERLNKLREKRDGLTADIQTLKSKLIETEAHCIEKETKRLEQLEQLSVNLNNKRTELLSKLNVIQTEINSERKQINQLQTNKDACPTCSREYSAEHIVHVTKLISAHEAAIVKLTAEKETINSSMEECDKNLNSCQTAKKNSTVLIEKNNKTVNDNKTHELSIKHLNSNLSDVEDEIQIVLKEQNNSLKGKVTAIQKQTEELERQVNNLNHQLNVLDTVKFVVSEEGIKSFIVKKILKVLNSRLAFYLKKLEANCLCQFNEFFDEEIVDEGLNQKSYFNFSGGERKRIDLACLFAFADIRRLQGDVNFSTVFYDELLDSSLDDRGVHLTLKLLRERFNETGESCYIITHRGPEVTTKAEHTIHVVKKNGISSVQP